jgi:ApaG protein
MTEKQDQHAQQDITVSVDRLEYAPNTQGVQDKHAFTYHISIHNNSQRNITLLARKWVITYEDEHIDVIEGDGIVGKCPEIAKGKTFAYQSFHLVRANASVHGSYHGVDDNGAKFTLPIPNFKLTIIKAPKIKDEDCN